MRQLTDREKVILSAGAAAMALMVAAVCALTSGRKDVAARMPSLIQTIPDAEIADAPDSKREAYRRGPRDIGSYWDSLGEENGGRQDEGIAAERNGTPPELPSALTYEDLAGSSPQPSGQDIPRGRTIRDDPQRQAILRAIEQAGQPQDSSAQTTGQESAAERLDAVVAQIHRTGPVSSLDGSPDGDLGSGISSLDGQACDAPGEGHPYRCMFCRDEKVRSGQRVPVRLLEDMVIEGTLIPKNTRLSAVCTIGGRMEVSISTVEMGERIHAVSLEGYDTDGSKGIYCSDLVESTRRIRSQGLSTAGSILGGRNMVAIARDAANVGLALAQSASGESTVSIPSGYVFYLVEKRQ